MAASYRFDLPLPLSSVEPYSVKDALYDCAEALSAKAVAATRVLVNMLMKVGSLMGLTVRYDDDERIRVEFGERKTVSYTHSPFALPHRSDRRA